MHGNANIKALCTVNYVGIILSFLISNFRRVVNIGSSETSEYKIQAPGYHPLPTKKGIQQFYLS